MIHDSAKYAPAEKVGRDKKVAETENFEEKKQREKLTKALNAGLWDVISYIQHPGSQISELINIFSQIREKLAMRKKT